MKALLFIFTFTFGLLFSQRNTENHIPGNIYPVNISALQNTVKLQRGSAKPIKNVSITLPNYSGEKVVYNLVENDLTTERIAHLTTFNGVSADGTSKLKLSLFQNHLIGIIKNNEGYFYIEPYHTTAGNYRIYPAFADFGVNFTCDIAEDPEIMRELNAVKTNLMAKSATNFPYGNQLRKFRMAIATTGEFTQAFAGDQNDALAEAVNMLNLINLIYENEVSITFTVIAKTTDKTLIFTNPATDPFTVNPSFASASNSQNGFTNMNTSGTLPFSLYDIGHTFNILTSGGAQGQAATQPCANAAKAKAWSQWALTMPKSIVANLIVHEMGHQFSAGHTYNAVGGSSGSPTFCTVGWSTTSAVEPGAGTTIMSYGNNCTIPANQTNSGNNSLDYFNAKSLDQIINNLTASGNCFTTQATANLAPSANAGVNITIPKNTPFKLNGIGSDPNDNNLSYTWEQADNASANDKGAFGSTINGVGGYTANNSNGSAPLFRSAQSNSSTARTFPRMEFILNNQNVPPVAEAEVLPAVARSMKFRFTVRDNNVASGGVDSDEMTVTVSNNGPLQVSYPSAAALSIAALSTPTITWNVNGTNALKSTVNIVLSIDGGNTYPYELAMNTANDGTEMVTIPYIPATATARIKVVAVINADAEFFDVSDNDFTITSTCNAYKSFISPTTDVNTAVGSTESNLNMAAPGAASNTFTIKNINYTPANATNSNILAYTDATLTTPEVTISNFTSVSFSFRVTKSGNYTFSRSAGFLIVTVQSGTPYITGNFVTSNAYGVGGGSYSAAASTKSAALLEGVTYYIVVCNYSDPANNTTHSVTSSGPGSLYDVLPASGGVNYTFIAINNSDSKIKAVSTTADFSLLPAGTYTVQGISFPNTVNSSTFVNKTIAEVIATGTCFALSGNERILQLNTVLGTVDTANPTQDFVIAPNPVGNYLTVKSKLKITDYQIFDLSGRMVVRTPFKSGTIDVSSLETGNYIITLLNNGKVLHQEKIIKK